MRLNKTLLLLIFFFVNQIEAALFDDYLATKLDKRVDPCDDFYSHVCRYYGYVNNLHKKYFHEFLELRMEFLNVMAEDTVIRDIQNYMISHASFTSKLDYKEIVQLLQVDIFSNLESQVKYVSSLADPLRLMFPSVLESLAVHDADRKSQDEMKADIVRIVNFIDKSTFEDCAAEYITMIMRPSLQMYFDEEFGDDQKLKEETFLRINTTFFGIQERLLQRIERSSSLIKKKEFVKRAVRSSYPVMDFDKAIQKPREFTLIAYRIRSQYQKDVSMSPNLSWLQRKIALLRATYKFGHSFNGDKMNMEAILSASWTNPTNVELVFSQTTRQGMVIIPAGAILAAKDMDDTELMGFLGSRMGHAIAHTAIQYNVVASSRHPELRERIWAIRRHYRFICDMFPEEPCSSFSEKDDLADFEGLFDIEEWFFEEEESKQDNIEGSHEAELTNAQRFFYSFALNHCGKSGDVVWHSPVRRRHVSPRLVRVNAAVSVNRHFREAFHCKIGSKLFPEAHLYSRSVNFRDFARSSDNQIIEVGGACDLPKHLGAITVEVNARFNDGVMVEAPHQTGDGTLRESTQGNNRPKADSSSRRRARRALRTADNKMRLPTAKYEVYMQRLFYWLGSSIGRHPWKYIGGLLLITGLSAFGFLRFNQINNARITFTDSEAMSRYEGRIVERFLKQNGTLHMIEVMISAADNGSLLRPDFLEQLDNFSDELSNQITVRDEHNQEVTFREMCDPYCQRNDPFFAVIKMLRNNVSEAEITYPVMEFLGQRVFIGSNFYGVTTDKNTTNMEDFKTVILHYFLVHDEMSTMIRWEDAVVNLCYESDKYGLLRASTASDHLVAKEVRAMGTKTAPLLAVALFILMIFLVICSFRYTRRESKPLEAMLGGITPILAAVTTVGMVSATGYAFQSIVVSTMFLLLAIGIDDVFIMLAAWHRTDKCKDVPTRMAEMLREAGCSMTVTSVTNFISFGNGVLSTTPVLQCFAIYSTVASVVCFIYQLILFPAVLALNAHKEQKGEEEECKTCLPEKIEAIRHAGKVHDVIFKGLAKVVCSWWMAAITILALSCYWSLSVYGIMTVKTELGIQHLAPPDSRISQFKTEYEFVIKSMQTLGIVVQHPGDLRDPNNMKKLKQMIRDFETEKYSYGHDSTFCFLEAYEDYLRFYRAEGDEDTPVNFTYVDFPEFVEDETTKHFRATLKLNETACKENLPECLDSFLFSTGFTTVSYYSEMYPVIERWRAISEKYPQFGVVSYTERHNFADQSASLDSVIWQTAYSEVLCMALSFIIFIPDLTSIVAGMFAMISVNLGVLGFLSLWGVMIDPFSMASLLMSIGFSVDITSHISYHYYEVPGATPRQKLEQTFLHIGWPTIQGAMSTFVAMVFVLMKPSHLGTVFFKTITLVMIFGLLHGLIILPVFLSLFDKLFKRKNKVTLSDALNSSGQKQINPHQISIKSFTQIPDERF